MESDANALVHSDNIIAMHLKLSIFVCGLPPHTAVRLSLTGSLI